jgi:hypothetical protein
MRPYMLVVIAISVSKDAASILADMKVGGDAD